MKDFHENSSTNLVATYNGSEKNFILFFKYNFCIYLKFHKPQSRKIMKINFSTLAKFAVVFIVQIIDLQFLSNINRGADYSLARPTSRCILFDGKNISFDASLVIHTHTHTHIYIVLLFLQL